VTYSSALEETQKDLYINGEAIITMYQPAGGIDGINARCEVQNAK
jgi:hypothetical protein